MMRLVSDKAVEVIEAYSAANANVFNDHIYPIVASQLATYPFVVYEVRKNGPMTKDGVHDVVLSVTIVDDKYARLCDQVDALEDFFEGYPEFNYDSTESGFNPEKYEEHYMTMEFNSTIKK